MKWERRSHWPSWCRALASDLSAQAPRSSAQGFGKFPGTPQGVLGNERGRAGAGARLPTEHPGILTKDTSGKAGGERDARQTGAARPAGGGAGDSMLARCQGWRPLLLSPQPHPMWLVRWSPGPAQGAPGHKQLPRSRRGNCVPHSIILGKRRTTFTTVTRHDVSLAHSLPWRQSGRRQELKTLQTMR